MASQRKKHQAFSRFLAMCLVSSTSVSGLNVTTATPTTTASPTTEGMHASVTQVFVNCTRETFTCASDRKCLPKTYMCDGISHCADKSDETGCSKYECDLKDFFQCDTVECYPLSWKCDGQEDCLDGTDEQNCPKRNGVVCAEGHFRCNMGLCAPDKWRCDGSPDCPDGSDEHNCTTVHLPDHGVFECNDASKTTVPLRWVCDKSPDCPNRADEADCVHHVDSKKNCSLPQNDFTCDNKRECIPMVDVCDGSVDCSDRSDEPRDCSRSCTTKKCEQGCIKLPSRFSETCLCESGFKLNADGLSCDDIDECANYGVCSQVCTNTRGGFECSCLEGYDLSQDDNATCQVNSKSRPAVLFFAAKTMIGSMSLGDNNIRTVTENRSFVRQAVGISYDAVDRRIFWTNLERGKQAILSSTTDGSNVKVVMNSSLKHPEDIAIDSYTRTLYYTDSGAKIIGVCTLDGAYCNKLITDNLDQPRGIALHQEKGLLFYADWGVRPHISTAGMDGSDHRMLITHNLKWPNGIVVDRTIDRIFWADANLDRIESARLDGTDRRIIIQLSYSHPFSVAVFENNIFWSDWSKNEILSCDKFTGAAHRNWFQGISVLSMGIHIFHENLEPISESLCYGSPCDHICLKSPKAIGFACKCKDGYKVQNGTKCVQIEHHPKILTIPSSQTTQRPSNLGVHLSRSMQNGGDKDQDRSPDGQPIKERLDSHADIIVGVVFGAIALALVVVAICCCVKKRASRKGAPACPFRLSSSSRVSFERRGGIEAGRITVDASNNEKSLNNMKTSVSNSNLDSHSRTNDFVNRSLSHPDLEYHHRAKEDRTDGACLVDEEDDSHSWYSDTSKLVK